eukprot:CFRG1201T1
MSNLGKIRGWWSGSPEAVAPSTVDSPDISQSTTSCTPTNANRSILNRPLGSYSHHHQYRPVATDRSVKSISHDDMDRDIIAEGEDELLKVPSGFGLRNTQCAVHKLALVLPKRVVRSHESLQGEIHVENWTQLPAEAQLILSVEGTEHARLKSKGIAKTLSLIDFKCIAYSSDSRLTPGTHVIPFTFRVPELPATCARETMPFRAAICYNLTAQFVGLASSGPMTRSQVFMVTHNTKADPADGPQETIRHINSSGDYVVQCWLARNRFTTADVVALKVRLNSTSIAPIHGVQVSLKNIMSVRMEGYLIRHEEVVLGQTYPGFSPCFYGERFISFSIGRLDCYTTSGTMLQSSFELHVSLVDKNQKDLISVTLPITIVPAEVPADISEDQTDAEKSFRPPWQMDKDSPKCNACQRRFLLYFCVLPRRHHCRHCGLVFCTFCCNTFTIIANLGYYQPTRVCDLCVNEARLGGRKYVGTLKYKNSSGAKRIRTLSDSSYL